MEWLSNVNRPIRFNGVVYDKPEELLKILKSYVGEYTIEVLGEEVESNAETNLSDTYRIVVRPYMCALSSEEFDFHNKWNNGVPMPLREMTGEILRETRGMYYMKLHGDVYTDQVNCVRCGRKLTHPISRLLGIGPECGNYSYTIKELERMNPNELEKFVEESIHGVRRTSWEGWIIKSAIRDMKKV